MGNIVQKVSFHTLRPLPKKILPSPLNEPRWRAPSATRRDTKPQVLKERCVKRTKYGEDRDARINYKDPEGFTALYCALNNGHTQIVNILGIGFLSFPIHAR